MSSDFNQSGHADCPLCAGEVSKDFVETITAASASIGAEMTPDAFREWLMDESRESKL